MPEVGERSDTAVRRITLPLDLTGDAVPALRTQLQAATQDGGGGVVEVDGQDVEHLDTTALAVLVAGHRAARARGGSLHVIHPSWLLIRRLRETGLDHVLKVVVDAYPPRPWSDVN
jgi:anti-anti-sigma factor